MGNGNGHIGNGKMIEAENGGVDRNGFYKATNQHGHPVCLTSYQAHNETSMPQPCPALPPPVPSPDTKQKRKNKSTTITHLRSALVILALSIHSLFEGMAV